jgi:RNA polymerase sigma-70 factor (ECF subfamily)
MGRADKQPTLEQMVSDHLPEALRFATRLTGDPVAAEDVLQEALVRAVRSWKSFRGEAQVKTWLFRIVVNVFRDRLSSAPNPTALVGDIADGRGSEPSAAAEAAELSSLIARHVSALPPRQREVLVLIAFESFSVKQVAEMLAITEANVHATLHVAREKLRRDLAGYFVEK